MNSTVVGSASSRIYSRPSEIDVNVNGNFKDLVKIHLKQYDWSKGGEGVEVFFADLVFVFLIMYVVFASICID